MQGRQWLWAAGIAGAGLTSWLAWSARFELGVSGEWTWERRPPAPDLGLVLLPALLAAAACVGMVWLGSRRIDRCGRAERWSWLVALAAATWAWLWCAPECAPPGHQLNRIPRVLYYPGSSGYFTVARGQTGSVSDFLKSYADRMALQEDWLHLGTHPPGLVVAYRGLIELCRAAPAVTDLLIFTQPRAVCEAFDLIAANARGSATPLMREDRAVLWLAAMLVQGGAALTVLPLYALLRLWYRPLACWLAAAFWPAVPAMAVFLPKSDALYPFLGTLFLWLWLAGWRKKSALLSCAAGVVLFAGMNLTLALLPVVFLAGCLTVWEGWLAAPHDRIAGAEPRLWHGLVFCSAGFGVPCTAAWLAWRLNLPEVWFWNYQNHALFYRHFVRTYWKWLAVNPLELIVAAGAPLSLIALASTAGVWRAPRSRHAGVLYSVGATWICLWLSGKNMGEASRLWLVLMPSLILVAGAAFDDKPPAESEATAARERRILQDWAVGLGCQFAAALAIVTRIVGFSSPS